MRSTRSPPGSGVLAHAPAENCMGDSLESLLEQAREIGGDVRFRRAVLACSRQVGAADCLERFNADIHPNDQMFTHSLREHRDAAAALSQYFNIAVQQHDGVCQMLASLLGE